MKRWTMIAAALVALTAATGGCGDDGNRSLTLEEYFEQVQGVSDDAEHRTDDLTNDFRERTADAGSLDDVRDEVKGFFEQQRDITQDLSAEIEGIEPPAAVADVHNAAVRAFDEFLSAFEDLIDSIDEAETVEDITSPAFEDADERLDLICGDLQTIADDEGIDVDLRCEDD